MDEFIVVLDNPLSPAAVLDVEGNVIQPLNQQNVTPRSTRNRNQNTVGQGAPPPANDDTSSPVVVSNKKRKRAIVTPSPRARKSALLDDDDDGATCPICLDHWEISGDHRLTSLKCGHLFGQSCIRRWLQECMTGSKCCPSCKTKATTRDFRFLFAKKLCVVDNTETERFKTLLDEKTTDYLKLTSDKNIVDFELQHQRQKLLQLQEENDYLRRRLLNAGTSAAQSSQQHREACMERLNRLKKVKLFLEKNIEISKDPGCRCLVSSRSENLLFVSQKSSQSLFPGYGLRYIDLDSLKPSNFVFVSAKQIRDLVVSEYSANQSNYLLTATMETCGRLYDITSKSHAQSFTAVPKEHSDDQLYCCTIGQNDTLFYGGQRGSVYVFDRRNPSQQQAELTPSADKSPVINVAHLPPSQDVMPNGGLLVCKLRELIYMEFLSPNHSNVQTLPTGIEGPFSSMSFDAMTGFVLITTRSSKKYPQSRYLMAKFERPAGANCATLVVKHTFLGSDVMPVMSRPVQYHVYGADSVMMTAYLQSAKMLTTWAVENNLKIQSLAVTDTVLDMCPVYLTGVRHIAALTDTKCRIFKIHEDRL